MPASEVLPDRGEKDRDLILRVAGVGAGYLVTAYLALQFTRFGAAIEAVWLSNAIVVWVLTTAPRRTWIYYILAAAIGHVSAHTLANDPFAMTAPALVGDMLECIIAAYLFTLRPDLFAMRRRADVWCFLAISCGVPLLSAAVTWAGKMLTPYPMSLIDFSIWIAADALAMIALLPALKGMGSRRWRSLFFGERRYKAWGWMAVIVAASLVGAFTPQLPGLRLALIPLLAVAAFEIGVVGMQAAMVVVTTTWLVTSIFGHGPATWYSSEPREQIVMAQYFAVLISAAILPLAATLDEKSRLTRTLSETLADTREAWGAIIAADARYRLVVDYATEMVMRIAPDGEILFASKMCDKLCPNGTLTGANIFALMNDEDADSAQRKVADTIAGGFYNLPQHWTYRLQRVDGPDHSYDVRATLVAPGGKKAPHEFVFVLRAPP